MYLVPEYEYESEAEQRQVLLGVFAEVFEREFVSAVVLISEQVFMPLPAVRQGLSAAMHRRASIARRIGTR